MTLLHGYILRELLRNFGLTLLALTALFTMGGGLYNLISYEGVSAADVFGFVPLLVPIVVTLTMPVAALFATTLVYGRLAADNELLACRAAGINVHRLFLPALLLAVFVVAFTTVFGNYVIPSFMRRMDFMVRSNVRDIAYQQLRSKGHLRYGEKYFLTAEDVRGVPEDQLRERGFPTGGGFSYLWVVAPTFLQLEDAKVVRFTSAEWGLCQFDAREREGVRVAFWAGKARDFEIGKRAVEIDGQKLGSYRIPVAFPNKPSWQDLATLALWRAQPWQSDRVRGDLEAFTAAYVRERFYAACAQHLAGDGALVLRDDAGATYEIRAESITRRERGTPALGAARVSVARAGGGVSRYEAPRAELIARPAGSRGDWTVELRLMSVAEQRVRELGAGSTARTLREYTTLNLDGLLLPEDVEAQRAALAEAAVFDRGRELTLSQSLADQRAGLWTQADRFVRKLDALIHFRLGYAGSALVTVVMGAILGVVFRGARALSAFGIACIPFGTMTILMIMGRQLAENRGTEAVGLGVIWGGLAAGAAADALLLRLGVHR